MEPWRAEGQWETVKPLKGGKAVAKDDSQGQTKKSKKGVGMVIQPEFRERTGVDPSSSAFSALDAWERRRAAAAAEGSADSDAESDSDSDDGFSMVRRKKGKPTPIVADGTGTDGAFGWAPIGIPGQPLAKKPKQPRAPRPSVADCGAALDPVDLEQYLQKLEVEYPAMNHLVFFGEWFQKAFDKADAVALNKLVSSTPIAAAAEQPLVHVSTAVVAIATKWLSSRDFDDVSEYAAAIVLRLGDSDASVTASPASNGAGSGKISKGGVGGIASKSSGPGSSAPPARPTAGLLITIALVLRAVPSALNSPAAEKRLMNPKHSRLPRPEYAPMLAWVVAQACTGNAAAGLGLWSRTMLPLALDAAAKRGRYTAAERDETTRLAASLAEMLTATPPARRRLSGAAAAMSVESGVHPSAVDVLLRAGATAPPAIAQMLRFLTETCRAPNGAQRAAGVAAEMWPLAAAQAGSEGGAGAEVVCTAGLDSLAWCVGAGSSSALPALCEAAPGVGRDVMRRLADVLEGNHTPGTTVVVARSALMKRKAALGDAVAEIRAAAAAAGRSGGGGTGGGGTKAAAVAGKATGSRGDTGKAWRELDTAAKRVQRIIGIDTTAAHYPFSAVIIGITVAFAFLMMALVAAATPFWYMTTPGGSWMLEAVVALVPGDKARVDAVRAAVLAVASKVEGLRSAAVETVHTARGFARDRGYTL